MFLPGVKPVLTQAVIDCGKRPLLITSNKSESAGCVMAFLEKRSKMGRRRKTLISQISPATNKPR